MLTWTPDGGLGTYAGRVGDRLVIQGAREHNLRDISLELPRDKLIVFTGISGSGKSSLAFDTIYAEGQRRYVESLSAYARQFLGQMDKPDVDFIEGLSPAISIDQKSASRNPRSTVGTSTEIYDYLRLLFARIGVPHDPETGEPLVRQTPQQIVDRVLKLPDGTRFQVLAPVVRGRKGTYETLLAELEADGYVRARVDGRLYELADVTGTDSEGRPRLDLARYEMHDIEVVVDRLVCRPGIERRLTDSVEAALRLADGIVQIEIVPSGSAAVPAPVSAPVSAPGRADGANDPAGGGRLRALSTGERAATSDADYDPDDDPDDPAGVLRLRPPSTGERAATSDAEDDPDHRDGGDPGDPDGDHPGGDDPDYDPNDNRPDGELLTFSQHLARPSDGKSFEELAPRNFSFNSPYGACTHCDGLGTKFEVDPELVVPDPALSLAEGALAPWAGGYSQYYERLLESTAEELDVDFHAPWESLPEHAQKVFLHGGLGRRVQVRYRNRYGRARSYQARFEGVVHNLQRLHSETGSDNRRQQIEGYMREVPCTHCGGARLRPLALAVTIDGRNINDVCTLSIAETAQVFDEIQLSRRDALIADQVLKELRGRLGFLVDVGLDYLTLARSAGTLSGGEAQRIRLASQIGSGLVGVLYVLDEPSIGLHQRDNARLLDTLLRLRDLGNTVIVVEHDEETIRSADHVVDIGPGAGEHGGDIVHTGPVADLVNHDTSLTGQYLSGRRSIPLPQLRRPPGDDWLVVRGAREHNLADIDVEIPLGCFVTVTGVSGSGKSTLVNDILYRALMQKVYRSRMVPGRHRGIDGIAALDKVINIDQQPIGRTPRSNAATYTGVFDHIRKLFAKTGEARVRGYLPGRFSFNVSGGRCEACSGDGNLKIEMHFLPDVYVPCEVCRGARYNRDTLDITFKGHNIAEVLAMPCEQALEFFANQPPIARHLRTLVDVGLGYIKLGQPAPTLSGGEAQRVKLASELAKRSTGHTIYLLDEPTTGLHFEDIRKLLVVLGRLTDAGNTVLVIEHNLDVIKTADWIIDLGPEGGDRGGRIVAEGPPELVVKHEDSHTGRFLRRLLV